MEQTLETIFEDELMPPRKRGKHKAEPEVEVEDGGEESDFDNRILRGARLRSSTKAKATNASAKPKKQASKKSLR